MTCGQEQLPATDSAERYNAEIAVGEFLGFWVHTWIGIILAGATFGFFAGFGIGAIPGALIAAIVSLPFIYTCAALSWALWLMRFSVAFAAVAGACTGAISTMVVWSSLLILPYFPAVVIAALIGGCGGGMLAYHNSLKSGWPREIRDSNGKQIWQFSLSDLFLRFTAVSLLIALWTLALAKLLPKLWP